MQSSGVESHSALGSEERYPAFLSRVYNKVQADSPNITPEQALALSLKAVNDTAGPSGLVRTLLVFGVMPQIPIQPQNLPNQAERMIALVNARKEMSRIIAKERLDAALRCDVPRAAYSKIYIADEVLIYREKPFGKGVGPYIVRDIKSKKLILDTIDREINATLSVDKVNHYNLTEPSSSISVSPNEGNALSPVKKSTRSNQENKRNTPIGNPFQSQDNTQLE